MFKKSMKALQVLICAVLIVQLAGCGTIMYPERKGQKGGKIDAGVAILDGIGLLLFLIPGIIAFAVDFNNGTIYLPGTAMNSSDPDGIREVKFDPKNDDLAVIERIIKEETGHAVKLNQSNMNITKLRSTDDMLVQFAQILPSIRDNRMASSR